nr:MAG TPA_asm: Baseplate structural protein [Caudoviricetes sp.]
MALVGAVVVSVTSLSLAKVNSVAINCMAANKVALQAHQYAASKGELVRATKYDELAAQARQDIQNSEFQDEIIVGAETDYPGNDTIKQKICTINVYKAAEALPRSSLIVTRLSAQPDSGIPKGSIIPWYGALGNIPNGFALCNGANGTPDLRDKFIVGSGKAYALGDTGGADSVKLNGTQIGKHFHRFGYNKPSNGGMWPRSTDFAANAVAEYPPNTVATKWNGSGGGNWYGWDNGGSSYLLTNLVTTYGVATAAQEAHENRPPFYALYYIMKV